MISIVIPLYNKKSQIKRTLNSVLSQTFQDFEIVIVNDGSTDGSADIVLQFKDARIRLINQENGGVSSARNRGIKESKYDYIALLDSDDEWMPDYLQTQVDLINKYPKCRVFACRYEFRNNDGVRRPIILNKMSFRGEDGVLENYFEVAAFSHPPICSISVLTTREAFLSIGGFPVGIVAGEDLLTWARLAVKYKIAYSMKTKAIYNLDEKQEYDRPPRIPENIDFVGSELLKIYKLNPRIQGLLSYIALWHKMRASTYLRLDDSKNALKEILRSLKYNCFNIRTWVFLLLCFCPLSFRYRVFKKYVR